MMRLLVVAALLLGSSGVFAQQCSWAWQASYTSRQQCLNTISHLPSGGPPYNNCTQGSTPSIWNRHQWNCPSGVSEPPPGCDKGWSNTTGTCACNAGTVVKPNGQCATGEDGPTECGEGYSKFTVGNQTSCIEQMPSNCGSGGNIWVNGVDACQSEKDSCNGSGGTFGIVGTSPVCIPADYASQLPTCASGSAEYFDNGNGTSAFACATVTAPASERAPVQVTSEDPTGLGGKMDAVIQAIERGTAVLSAGQGGAVGPVAGGIGPGQGPGEGDGEGEGAGDCDPTADDYAFCIGQSTTVGDNADADLIAGVESDGTALLDALETDWVGQIDGADGIDEPSTLKSLMQSLVPSSGACVEFGFEWQGASWSLDCSKIEDLKLWLGFLLYIYTAWTIWGIATAPAPARG